MGEDGSGGCSRWVWGSSTWPGAYLLFLPFFQSYVNVGASGVGLLREPDPPEQWLLVWGFLGFVVLSWILFAQPVPPGRSLSEVGYPSVKPAGIERATSLFLRQFDRLPRVISLHQRLVTKPRFFYLILLILIPLTALLGLGCRLSSVGLSWQFACCLWGWRSQSFGGGAKQPTAVASLRVCSPPADWPCWPVHRYSTCVTFWTAANTTE